ncbi:MAG: hypothetical protein A2352_07025 [Caulobacterales bacterium RIFOXYB1_FULL_67_16]|nr:MAG: hypothetical protein A2352_07025 [Caulobacterales bacterium RIFOXYB1_FULL_67_16]
MSDDAKSPPVPAEPKTPGSAPEPFQRKQVTWGRMPAVTFHVGPVPVAPNPLDRIPDRPLRKTLLGQRPAATEAAGQDRPQPRLAPRPNAAILSGSLIPQARPATASLPTPPAPTPAPEPGPTAQTSLEAPLAQAAETTPAPAAAAPSSAETKVSPRVSRRTGSRLPAYLAFGAAAAVIVGGGLWFALRSTPEPAAIAEPAAPLSNAAESPVAPAPVEDAPASAATAEPTPDDTAPATATPDRPEPSAPAAARSDAGATGAPNRTPAAVTAAPASTPVAPSQPVAVEAPPPQIIVAPAPTPARQTPTDPDAPVVTRPQPLD